MTYKKYHIPEHMYNLVCFYFKDRKWMLSPKHLNSSRFVTSCFWHGSQPRFKIWNLAHFLHFFTLSRAPAEFTGKEITISTSLFKEMQKFVFVNVIVEVIKWPSWHLIYPLYISGNSWKRFAAWYHWPLSKYTNCPFKTMLLFLIDVCVYRCVFRIVNSERHCLNCWLLLFLHLFLLKSHTLPLRKLILGLFAAVISQMKIQLGYALEVGFLCTSKTFLCLLW